MPPSPRFGQVPGYGTVMAGGGQAPQFFPINPQGISTQEAAKTIGANTGKDVAALVPQYMTMGQKADQALNVIDSGIQHLQAATRDGIPSGYFSPALAEGAAMMKSLGIPTSVIGVDPKAVGDVQTAQKTLGIVSGAILQNVIGKDSQITDAKIQHFIETQPDLAMDPNALQRILGWARSQFQYEHDMAFDAMGAAAQSPTGTLPLNWAPNYYKTKGAFAPIYDPMSGQSTQPTGAGPPREAPAATTIPDAAAALLKEGVHQHFGNGQTWTLRNGKPVQVP
jgi:hypothetical protein